MDRGRFVWEGFWERGDLGTELGRVDRSRFWGKGLQGEGSGEGRRFRVREDRKGGLGVGGQF